MKYLFKNRKLLHKPIYFIFTLLVEIEINNYLKLISYIHVLILNMIKTF